MFLLIKVQIGNGFLHPCFKGYTVEGDEESWDGLRWGNIVRLRISVVQEILPKPWLFQRIE
jgi:hypothetical protein